ncbi:MAG: hypothetical protein VXX59_05455, partial [Candidatus Thermoplasmatota archaeon]|nr:hypothetical protein [Candidatus Thermoplasmatota archaeon]
CEWTVYSTHFLSEHPWMPAGACNHPSHNAREAFWPSTLKASVHSVETVFAHGMQFERSCGFPSNRSV